MECIDVPNLAREPTVVYLSNIHKLVRVTTVPQSLGKLLDGQLKFMTDSFDVIAISSPGELLDAVRDCEEVTTHALSLTRSITPIRDLIAIGKLYLFLRKLRPTIVHTHTPKAGMVGMIAAKLASVPIRLHTVAGLPVETKKGLVREILLHVERFTYRCAHRVYPNSQGMREFIEQAELCQQSKIRVIGNGSSNGINLDHFQRTPEVVSRAHEIRREHDVSENDILFCFIGRLVRDKGIEELMWSFEKIAQDHPNAKLILLGKFEEHLDPLSEQAKSTLENHPRVQFVGYQSDVRPFLVASDIFVFPSYREGLPNVLLQAGAMGVASVATRINGCTDIVEDGKNGILVDSQDKEKLLQGMKQMLEDPELRSSIAHQSRDIIVQKYDQRLLWQSLHEEYQQLIEAL